MKAIKNTTEFNEILNQDKPVLIDFYADWCGPCQTLLPIVDELAEKHKEDFEIVKVDIDTNQELAQKFQIRSIPALFFIKNGEIVDRIQGLQTKSVLESKINAVKAA